MDVEPWNGRRWYLIDFSMLRYVRATYQTFGFRSALTLASPLMNTIIHWKHRNSRLVLPGDKE